MNDIDTLDVSYGRRLLRTETRVGAIATNSNDPLPKNSHPFAVAYEHVWFTYELEVWRMPDGTTIETIA